MPHIHTEYGQHDITISGLIFRTDFDHPKVMIHLHKKLHTYMQFGGHIELDEDPLDALIREIKEEAGYSTDQLKLLLPSQRITKFTNAKLLPLPLAFLSVNYNGNPVHKHDDIIYALVTDNDPKDEVESGESTDIKQFSRDEILHLPSSLIFENLRETILFAFDNCLNKWDEVAFSEFMN